MEKKSDYESNISDRTRIIVPIGAVVGLVVGIALLFYGQLQYLHTQLETKSGDRYTRSEHNLYATGERDWNTSEHARIEAGCR